MKLVGLILVLIVTGYFMFAGYLWLNIWAVLIWFGILVAAYVGLDRLEKHFLKKKPRRRRR